MPCLKYAREEMAAAWDSAGIDCGVAFYKGSFDQLQCFHSHGAPLVPQSFGKELFSKYHNYLEHACRPPQCNKVAKQ